MTSQSPSLAEVQSTVDTWITTIGVRYFSELTNMAILTEEVGELARIMARRYGDQSEKPSDAGRDLGDEMADVLWVLAALANQTGVDLSAAFCAQPRKEIQPRRRPAPQQPQASMSPSILRTFCTLVLALAALSSSAQRGRSAEQLMPTSAEDRLNAALAHDQLDADSWTAGLDLRSVGPTVMSGRVVDLCVNPQNNHRIRGRIRHGRPVAHHRQRHLLHPTV